jgi:hypothetical protein
MIAFPPRVFTVPGEGHVVRVADLVRWMRAEANGQERELTAQGSTPEDAPEDWAYCDALRETAAELEALTY